MEDLLKAILESMSSGVLAVDLDGRVLWANRALAELLGVPPETCAGKPASELFAATQTRVPANRLPLYRLDPRRDAARTHSREVEWSDGKRTIHLREDSAPLRDSSQRPTGRVFAYHDRSWEKTIDQMKSEFISIASHELRTPMTAIKGSVDLILGGSAGEANEEIRELLGVAHSACDRMIRLINDILDLSKIEAGQIQLQLERVDLTQTAKNSLRGLKALADQDGIALKLEGATELTWVMGDRDRLEQVITNLVSNAIKYSPAKGEVTIRLSAENGWVKCAVSDQGCGIDEKNLDRIFGKFQQVGAPQRGSGTGLGLAITRGLVVEHKGRIWVESRVGKGSCFTFCVPADPTSKGPK